MKRIAWFFGLMAVSALYLAGCGGGGGGGGDGSKAAYSSTSSQKKLLPQNMVGNIGGATLYHYADKDPVLGYYSDGDVKAGTSTFTSTFTAAQVANAPTQSWSGKGFSSVEYPDVDYHVLSRNSSVTLSPTGFGNSGLFPSGSYFTGPNTQYQAKDILWLGKLDYAAFGYWAQDVDVKFNLLNGNGILTGKLADVHQFYVGLDQYKAGYNTSLAQSSFRGPAAGMATYVNMASGSETVNSIPLVGTALLNMPLSSSSYSSSLNLTFNNGFVLAGTASVTPGSSDITNGNFSYVQQGSMPGSATLYNSTPSGRFSGQFYGANNTPSEAAGHFSAALQSGAEKLSVDGAYGVKKQK